jgi:hypothetical protein
MIADKTIPPTGVALCLAFLAHQYTTLGPSRRNLSATCSSSALITSSLDGDSQN